MEYKDFLNTIIESLKISLGESAEITCHSVAKPNEILEGLTIRFHGKQMSPTVYPESLYKDYQNGRSMESITQAVINMVRDTPKIVEKPVITQEEAKKNLYTVIINFEKNTELLKDVPYERFQDLAIIPRWRVGEEASFLVHNNMLPELRLTKEELMEMAQANTDKQEFRVIPLPSMIQSLMGPEYGDDLLEENKPELSMYVVTNEKRFDGAVAMTSDKVMKSVREQIGEDIYILPSSRHEIICVKQSECPDTVALAEMVSSVNASTVSTADYLSDSVYSYNGHKITMANGPSIEKTETQMKYRVACH